MRVLQLHNRQLGYGGADLVIKRERDLLQSHGHEVTDFFVDNRSLESMSRIRAATKAIWNREAVNGFESAVSDFRPDIVHIHTPFPIMSPAVIRASHRLRLPTVQTCHSFRNVCANGLLLRTSKDQLQVCTQCVGKRIKWPAVTHRCYKRSIGGSCTIATALTTHSLLGTFSKCVDQFIALTNFAKKQFLREGIAEEKIFVKQNFLPDVPQLGNGNGGNAFFVGRLEPEKGIRTLLKAWTQHDIEHPLLIAGDGSLRDDVVQAAAECKAIKYLGSISQAEVFQNLQNAALMVFPSQWYEAGFTLVMIEALACGCPILASDVGNFSDSIQHDVTGRLFKSGNAADLASVAKDLLANPDSLQQMRIQCRREFASRYSAEVNYPLLLEVYSRALEKKN